MDLNASFPDLSDPAKDLLHHAGMVDRNVGGALIEIGPG